MFTLGYFCTLTHTHQLPYHTLLYNFSSLPSPACFGPLSPPASFPPGVLEGYVNGQRGRLRKRWEEWCEKGETRCWGHYWVITWLHSVWVYICERVFLFVCFSVSFLNVYEYVRCSSEWEVQFKNVSKPVIQFFVFFLLHSFFLCLLKQEIWCQNLL